MRLTFDYIPARDGLALLTGGPTQAGYAACAAAQPMLTWTPRYSDEASPKGGGNVWNGEFQFYVDPEHRWSNGHSPFHIWDGDLHIRLQRIEKLGFAAGEVPLDPLTNAPYGFVSGVLTSRHRFSQHGGYFEIEAVMPKGQGVWPAFWLLPLNERHPPEIDVVEYLGHEPRQYRATLLGAGAVEDAATINTGTDLSAGFHRYGALWTDTEIDFYLDGRRVATKDIRGKPEFAQPFYLLINLAVGSRKPSWVPPPDAATPNPADMVVRSVRAWQRLGPSRIALSSSFVRETAPVGTTVGTLSCSGLDAITSVSYSLVGGLGEDQFEVSGDQLRTAAPFEFRRAPSHVVTVRATDDRGRTWQQPVAVAVLDDGLAPNSLVAGGDLHHPAWTKYGISIRSQPGADRDAPSASIAEDSSTGAHALEQSVCCAGGGRLMVSVDLRPQGRSWVKLEVSAGRTSVIVAFFDLDTGQIGDRFASGGQTALRLVDCQAIPVGSGFCRCQVEFTAADPAFRVAWKIVTGGSDYTDHPGEPARGVTVRLPLRAVRLA